MNVAPACDWQRNYGPHSLSGVRSPDLCIGVHGVRPVPHLRLVAFFAVSVASSTAAAAAVVVTFDGGAAPVPIPLWLVPLIAVALFGAAYKPMQSRIRRSTMQTLSGVLLATGLTVSAVLSWMPEVRASAMELLGLHESPARFAIPASAIFDMVQSGAGYGFAVENQTGNPATIRGRSFEDNPDGWLYFYLPAPPIPEPECVPGLQLQAGGKCYIWMASRVHW